MSCSIPTVTALLTFVTPILMAMASAISPKQVVVAPTLPIPMVTALLISAKLIPTVTVYPMALVARLENHR